MNIPMMARTSVSFRVYTSVFVVLLSLQAAWLLSAEFMRAALPFFPSSQADIDYAAAQRNRATATAWIGWPRGDLWTDYALAADSKLLTGALPSAAYNKTELVSEHAAGLAPYDARLWLLLSASGARSGWKDNKTLAQLKMSYYTAPNEIRLIPARFAIATQSQAIGDEELQTLVAHEIRTILTRRPELKPVIAKAYRATSTGGRRFIDEQVGALDRPFLTELRMTQR